MQDMIYFIFSGFNLPFIKTKNSGVFWAFVMYAKTRVLEMTVSPYHMPFHVTMFTSSRPSVVCSMLSGIHTSMIVGAISYTSDKKTKRCVTRFS